MNGIEFTARKIAITEMIVFILSFQGFRFVQTVLFSLSSKKNTREVAEVQMGFAAEDIVEVR